MDFGLARDRTEQGLTATGAVLGTPHSMAPEQARGEVSRLDRRADVYSLGATLYTALTGQPPIPGDNGLEVLSNIATVEPRPARALNPALPVDLGDHRPQVPGEGPRRPLRLRASPGRGPGKVPRGRTRARAPHRPGLPAAQDAAQAPHRGGRGLRGASHRGARRRPGRPHPPGGPPARAPLAPGMSRAPDGRPPRLPWVFIPGPLR